MNDAEKNGHVERVEYLGGFFRLHRFVNFDEIVELRRLRAARLIDQRLNLLAQNFHFLDLLADALLRDF